MQTSFFNDAPLWALLLLIFGSLCLTAFVGAKLRGRLSPDPDDNASEGYLLSATLALLGLLIGFTFSMALARYDTRREMVVAEANAIGTAWLRAGLVDGAPGETLRKSLRDYGEQRLKLPQSADADAAESTTAALQARVWADMRAALPTMQQPIAATLVGAINEMFDDASSRRAERDARIPGLVLDILVVCVLTAGAMVGYVLGGASGRRHATVTGLLFLLLALAMTMILDLDRPWSGLVQVPQEPMVLAVAAMR